MDSAKSFGINILKSHEKNINDAVMFDIDHTLIFYDETPNKPIIDLAKYSKKLGYKIIIITARPTCKGNVEYTEYELKKHNIPFDLIIYASHEDKHSIKEKLSCRFVLSVGDLWTDITNSLHYIKLPSTTENIKHLYFR